jgi:hypothetical protein
MAAFRVGDSVMLAPSLTEPIKKDLVGTVIAVIPCDSGQDPFTLYDIQFEVGVFTLHGSQIEPAHQPQHFLI